jgi:hypothetical protein
LIKKVKKPKATGIKLTFLVFLITILVVKTIKIKKKSVADKTPTSDFMNKNKIESNENKSEDK